MKRYISLFTYCMLSSSIAYSAEPNILDVNNLPPISEPSNTVEGQYIAPTQTVKIVLSDGSTEQLTLTPDEIQELKDKQDALQYYFYEQQLLKPYRDKLQIDAVKQKYQDLLNKANPYTASQVKQLREALTESDKAQNSPLQPVKFQIRTVNTDTDATQPVLINVVKGYASSVQFVDQTGQPWPLNSNAVGNSKAFEASTVGNKNNIAMFQITAPFSQTNALVTLKGLDTTIVLQLVGNNQVVDTRLTVRIPKAGPNTVITPTAAKATNKVDPLLDKVLNGDTLPNAKVFEFDGIPGTAFYVDDALYIRSPYRLVIPLPIQAAQTSTGLNAYKTSQTEDFLFNVDGENKHFSLKKLTNIEMKQKVSLFK